MTFSFQAVSAVVAATLLSSIAIFSLQAAEPLSHTRLPETETIAEWRFRDPNAGATTASAGFPDRTVTLEGSVKRVDGRSGSAIRLDGASTWGVGPTVKSLDLYRTGTNEGILDGEAGRVRSTRQPTGLVIEAWVRPERLVGQQAILDSNVATGDQRSFSLVLEGDVPVFIFSTDGTQRGLLAGGLRSDVRVTAGEWNHIRVVIDGLFASVEVNGKSDGAKAFCPAIHSADRPIQIGRQYDGAKATNHFAGDIDMIRLARFETRLLPATEARSDPAFEVPGTRNNLVRDLIDVPHPKAGIYKFENARDGWVYLALRGLKPNDVAVNVTFDQAPKSVTLEASKKWQAMRYLAAGSHEVKLDLPPGSSPTALIVRQVPEMIYNRIGYGSHTPESLAEAILPYVNVCVSGPPTNSMKPVIDEWTSAGRKWLIERPSGYWKGEQGQINSINDWKLGFQPPYAGALVDEFGYYYGSDAFKHWANHVATLKQESPNYRFYSFVFGLERFPSNHTFLNTVKKNDGRVVWELYINETLDEAGLASVLDDRLIEPMRIVSKVFPDIGKSLLVCPSIWNGYGGLSNDHYAEVDQKVLLDKQFQIYAKDPLFRGLAGIAPWTSGYADQEMIRWLGALFSHYGIEGNTELLSEKYGYRYKIDYLDGAGFENPAAVSLAPAQQDSLTFFPVKDLAAPVVHERSWVQPRGEWCLKMTRSSAGANVARQKVKNLVPGQLYSVKVNLIDPDRPLDRPKGPLPFSIALANGELADDLADRHVLVFSRDKKHAFITRVLVVFRATEPDDEIILSDRLVEGEQSGLEGQSVLCDLLAVQPYFLK